MRGIPPLLFLELRNRSPRICTAWRLQRVDGQVFTFSTSDLTFTYDGDTYTPINGINPSAVVSKADASVDNLEVQVLINSLITEEDLRSGLWGNASVKVFWICPYHPEWGIAPLRGGNLGEIHIKNGQWTTQLRAIFQQMQLPFGLTYTLNCTAQLGDARCKVQLDPQIWEANQLYPRGQMTDAGKGSVVKPSVPNGFWYVADYAASDDPAKGIISYPGEGLSAMDDMGPNDDTQKFAGPAKDNLTPFAAEGTDATTSGPEK